jgi:hypothetical protein
LDKDLVKRVTGKLHPRGIRERDLRRLLDKYEDQIQRSCDHVSFINIYFPDYFVLEAEKLIFSVCLSDADAISCLSSMIFS